MNNIKIVKGSLMDYPGYSVPNNGTQLHIAHGVNCVGAMGAGIAIDFKKTFPSMYKEYKSRCERGLIIPGCCWFWEESEAQGYHYNSDKRIQEDFTDFFVYNLAIKAHWRMPASYIAMQGAVKNLIKELEERQVKEIAIPWIGCGLGGMSKHMVRGLLEKSFQNCSTNLIIYEK